MNNTDLYPQEEACDFDLKIIEADMMMRRYCHLSGDISFFLDECPGCGCTMPFEFDDGVCMKCGCDATAGIVYDMNEEEFDKLVRNNTYRINIPFLQRRPFETLPDLIRRQAEFRLKEATNLIEFKNETVQTHQKM